MLHYQKLYHCENGDKGKEKKVTANKRRSEKASKKHELIKLLKEYEYCGKNEAELTKETIARLMQNFL